MYIRTYVSVEQKEHKQKPCEEGHNVKGSLVSQSISFASSLGLELGTGNYWEAIHSVSMFLYISFRYITVLYIVCLLVCGVAALLVYRFRGYSLGPRT